MITAVRPLIAHYRVSTDRQGKSGLGIEAQRAAVEAFTAARLVERGVLKAQKLNGRTSPLIASRKHLRELRRMRVSADPVNEPRLI